VSTTYGWHCRTCSVESPVDWTRSQHGVVRALAYAARQGWDNLGMCTTSGQDSWWLEDHIGHDVVVVDEYGDLAPLDAP